MKDKLFRYYESCDEGGSPMIICSEYDVVKRTPKGFQIEVHKTKPKFVLDSGVKRFAHSDKAGAKVAFIQRKKSHLYHLKNNVEFIERVLELEGELMSSNQDIVSQPHPITNPFI